MSDKETDFPVLLTGDILRYVSHKGTSTYLVILPIQVYRNPETYLMERQEAVLFSLEKSRVGTWLILDKLNHIKTIVNRDGNVIYED